MANSRRHVDVIFFCLISLWGFIPHSTFAENPITAPPSITTSGVVEQSLDNINMPDPTEASKALVAVIPDSASLIKNYTGLMEIVRSAQGELDLSVLYDACTGCHRWHSDVIADKRKDLAILEWMSQKIWEMAGTPEKKQLLERYIGDVGRLMDEGKIHPLMGLKLTTYTMATRFVGSDVHTDALLNLFKRYMKTGNTKVDDFICYEFMVTTSAFLSEGIRSSDIVEILRQNYPTKNFPKDPLQFSYPPIPIWRKTYDDIMQLSPSELHKKIITPSDTIEKNYSCEVALARMLDLYDQDPREVKATIVDLLDKGLLMDTIPACLFSIPFYGQKVNKAHPIMLSDDMIELILSKYEDIMKYYYSEIDGYNIFGGVSGCLEELPLRNSKGEFPACENLQKHCIRILVDGVISWDHLYVRPPRATLNKPGGSLLLSIEKCSPTIKQYARELARKQLKDMKVSWWFAIDKEERIQKIFTDLATIK